NIALGRLKEGERADPLTQFVRAFLGGEGLAFQRLRRRFSTGNALANAPVEEIAAALGGGLAGKAGDLKRALQKIRIRAGSLDLEFLRTLDVDAALVWLEQIHGVSRRIAAATLNFSTLRRRAFVADADVTRVLERFGFVRRHAR